MLQLSQSASQPASQASHKVAVFRFKKYYRAFHFFFSPPSPPSPPSPLLRTITNQPTNQPSMQKSKPYPKKKKKKKHSPPNSQPSSPRLTLTTPPVNIQATPIPIRNNNNNDKPTHLPTYPPASALPPLPCPTHSKPTTNESTQHTPAPKQTNKQTNKPRP